MPIVPREQKLLHHRNAIGVAGKAGARAFLRAQRIDVARGSGDLPHLLPGRGALTSSL